MQSNSASVAIERRGHDRVQDAIYLQVVADGQQDSVLNILQDAEKRPNSPSDKVSLSASGIAFASSGFYPPGTTVTLALMLFPSQDTVMCQAKIVSAGDAIEVAKDELPVYRAAFVDLSQAHAELLANHVDGLLSRLTVAA